jgi:uncharacterized protein YjeT (DUF2065 family)
MKHLGVVEKPALLLACVLIIFGIYTAIHPTEMRMFHPGTGSYKEGVRRDSSPEQVSKEKARIYGVLSMVCGIGIGWLVVYRSRD